MLWEVMLKDALPNFEVTLCLLGGKGGLRKFTKYLRIFVSKMLSEYAATLLTTRLRNAATGKRSQVTFTDPSTAYNAEVVLRHEGIFTFHI
jgi:hypothetical protein